MPRPCCDALNDEELRTSPTSQYAGRNVEIPVGDSSKTPQSGVAIGVQMLRAPAGLETTPPTLMVRGWRG